MRIFVKLLLAATLSVLFAVSAYAETNSPNEADYYVGSSVTVEGVVSQVSVTRSGTTFINFGGAISQPHFLWRHGSVAQIL
tara:strand:- start:51 stop:293 length:243 start_codon:yes stop_codon:yes gene_type:complete